MTITYALIPLLAAGSPGAYLPGETHTSPSGLPWVSNGPNLALSCQPGGVWGDRPVADTATYEPGPWEQIAVVDTPAGTVLSVSVNGIHYAFGVL